MKAKKILPILAVTAATACVTKAPVSSERYSRPSQEHKINVEDTEKWELIWSDEFDYEDSELETNWISQNGPSGGGWVLCSRWRENAEVHDGILELTNRKQDRGGQEWTSASVWTKETFSYGYFECRYKYAGATGTNNSFWLWPMTGVEEGKQAYELDINEGHYPNEINTNIHNWSDKWDEGGVTRHREDPVHQTFSDFDPRPDHSIELETPVNTKRVRFSSTQDEYFHIREFRIYEANEAGYPTDVLSETADSDIPGLVNLIKDSGITISSSAGSDENLDKLADSKVYSGSWVSQDEGEKWIEFSWPEEKSIAAIQFINGVNSGPNWRSLIERFTIEFHDGTDWVTIQDFDFNYGPDYSEEFHTYGLEWTETEFRFYFDGKLFRVEPNINNHGKTNILLSLAILRAGIAGEVTDAIDGTSMKVDYVRYYKPVE